MMFRRLAGVPVCLGFVLLAMTPGLAEEGSSAGPLMNLLKSGRVPPERLGTLVDLVCKRGNASELAYIFEQTVDSTGYQGKLRLQALEALADAASTRKVVPKTDLSKLGELLKAEGENAPPDAVRLAAIRLAGIWKVPSLADDLQQIVLAEQSSPAARTAALEGLVALGGDAARDTVEKLTAPGQPQPLRYQGVAALASFDLKRAARRAAEVLKDGSETDDPSPLLEAFLNRQGGPDQLAAALADAKLPKSLAKNMLREIYARGRSDAKLVDLLGKVAGVGEVQSLTKEQVKQLAAEVLKKGDPARGEEIFRRADLSCMKCHSVSKAGGDIGPDLSAVGGSSPVDYLVNSIVHPNQAVKEAFLTKIIITVRGEIFQGIVVDRDDERVVLKDATGKQITIATADIDEEAEGKTLMPQGLTKFLTRDELIDLVRFLSELGKPGDYAVRSKPTIQRWRYLKPIPPRVAEKVPDETDFELLVLESPHWHPAYAKVAGQLPLDEIASGNVVYVQGEIEVTEAGEVGVTIDPPQGTHVWLNDESLGSGSRLSSTLAAGRHKLTLRVDLRERKTPELRVVLFKPSGSSAQFAPVDGK